MVFPFSIVTLSLFIVVVAVFFVVAIPVIVITYVILGIALSRRFMSVVRRLFLGSDQNIEWKRRIGVSTLKKDSGAPGTDYVLWDWWIDGSR